MKNTDEINELAKKINPHIDALRKSQIDVIGSIINKSTEKKKDVIAVMETGYGKSICYQVAALIFKEENVKSVSIVIQPLIALINNQTENISTEGEISYGSVGFTSQTSDETVKQYAENIERIVRIHTTPEQLHSYRFHKFLTDNSLKVNMVAIDEAHCVSLWGRDFRPYYRKIGLFIEKYRKQNKNLTVCAFTGTAESIKVQKDIIKLLGMRNITRDDIKFLSAKEKEEIETSKNHFEYIEYFKSSSQNRRSGEKEKTIARIVSGYCNNGDRGIIFCQTHSIVNFISDYLKKNTTVEVFKYYSGISRDIENLKDKNADCNDEKIISSILDNFSKNNNKPKVIVSTSAFGMGIDFSVNINYVIVNGIPYSKEDYIQQIGRAGRKAEGKITNTYLLCSGRDLTIASDMLRWGNYLAIKKTEAVSMYSNKVDQLLSMANIFHDTSNDIIRWKEKLETERSFTVDTVKNKVLVINEALPVKGNIEIKVEGKTEILSFYDCIISDAIYSIWRMGRERFGVIDILRFTSGKKIKTISDKRREQMEKSVQKLIDCDLIPCCEETGKGKDRLRFRFDRESYTSIEASDFKLINLALKQDYPMLLGINIDENDNQENIYSVMTQNKKQITDNEIMINYYLLRQLKYHEGLYRNREMENRILFYYGSHRKTKERKGIFEALRLYDNTSNEVNKNRIQTIIDYLWNVLSNLKNAGYIKEFEFIDSQKHPYSRNDKRNGIEYSIIHPEKKEKVAVRGIIYTLGEKHIGNIVHNY